MCKLIDYISFCREFKQLRVLDLFAVVLDGRHVDGHRVLRVAETAEAQVAQQSTLHHDQAESVRDCAHEGLSRASQTDAVVHKIVDGVSATQWNHAKTVQQNR